MQPLRSYLLLFASFVFLNVHSQSDSLLRVLNSKAHDTLRIQAGIKACKFFGNNNPDSCLLIANQVITLIGNKYEKYLPITLRIKGIAYVNKSDYKTSLDLYFLGLRIAERFKDQREIADINNNIGVNYWYQNDYKRAKQYYEKALDIRLKLKNQKDIAKSLNNLGTVEVELGQFDGALNHYKQSLEIKKALNDIGAIANSYNNIGIVYERKKDYARAIEYCSKALEIFRKENDKRGILFTFNNLAGQYKRTNRLKEAFALSDEALHLAKELGDLESQREAREIMAKAAYDEGKFREAFDHISDYVKLNDTLVRENNAKAMAEAEKKYQTEKSEKEIKLLENENKLKETEISSHKKERKYFFGIISLIAVLLGLGLLSYVKIRSSNRQLTGQKALIEEQKNLVEEQNKSIVDSINYAKRIQEAMLKEEQHRSMHLPAHFILFKPKDIVSGDFYWVLEKSHYLYITAADCTGHGVPGAFLTMLGTSFLNEINAVEEILGPAEILDRLRDKIVKELSADGRTKDGMDISLVRLDLKTNSLLWAGANNPLWIIRKNTSDIEEIAPDKQPVGFTDNSRPFTNHEKQLHAGDAFYLFTDGYADQFGGPKGKKFKYKQLKQVLINCVDQPMESQKEIADSTFKDWKGNLEQVDDVTIIALKI